MLEALTPRQWAEWVEYFGLEPWGFDVDDAGMGTLAATIAAAAGAKGLKPQDFMLGPSLAAREEQQQEAHTNMLVARLMAAWGPKPATEQPS